MTASSAALARRVLVVEDETVIALLIQDTLEARGFAVTRTSGDLDETTAIIRDERPDVAVLDLNLGALSGAVIAELLDGAGIPFVFATGYGRRAVPEKWRDRIVVQKPFLPDTLVAAVRSAMQPHLGASN